MISLLRGKIAGKYEGSLIVDVGGVGYEVTVPLSMFSNLPDMGAEVQLNIYTHARENSIELFGFLTDGEKKLFKCLIGVTGIGPKGAINILSNITPQELINSIITGDLAAKKVPGIGAKTSSRIINELKDKLVSHGYKESTSTNNSLMDDVISVLLNLGFTRNEIEDNRDHLNKVSAVTGNMEDLVRESLKIMRKL